MATALATLQMTTRPIAILVLGSFLLSTTAEAGHRRSRRHKRHHRIADRDDQSDRRDRDRDRRRIDREEAAEVDDQDGPEATSVLPIRLDDLIEIAVRLSPELARSKNDRYAARGDSKAARKDQEWVVHAGSEYSRFATAGDVEVGAFQVVAEDKLSANLGIGRNLPTGGNIGLEIGILRTVRELEIPPTLQSGQTVPAEVDQGSTIGDTYGIVQSQAKLTVTQPLARGFGRDVALAKEKKGDLLFAESTIKTQIAAEELLRNIVKGYWELAYSAYEVDTRAEALEIARNQEKTTRERIRAKADPKNALAQVQFDVASREEALLTAKNEWEKKSLELRKIAGLELGRRDIVMRPKERFAAAPDEWEVRDVLRRAHKSNRRLAAIILEKRAADVDVKVAKNSMLPQVDLSLSGALVGTGNTVDRSLSSGINSDGFQVMANLKVQFEIGGAAKGAHDAARARRQRLEIEQEEATRTLDTEIVHAVHAVKSARARVALSEKAVSLAEQNAKAESATLEAGLGNATHYTVMQRYNDLVDAKLRLGQAIRDYRIAVAQVQFYGGMLFEQYRVSPRPLARARR